VSQADLSVAGFRRGLWFCGGPPPEPFLLPSIGKPIELRDPAFELLSQLLRLVLEMEQPETRQPFVLRHGVVRQRVEQWTRASYRPIT
jgi:hypothetical protein